MADADERAESGIRALLDNVMAGSVHVDWQDTAHARQTLLMKLCYYNSDDGSILGILDDVFSLNPDVNLRDDYQRTAFTHACIAQNYTMADALLFFDSTSIDTVDKENCSPLTYAIKAEDEHMVDKILSHPKAIKSNLLTTRTKGKSPQELAMSLGNPAIVNTLRQFSRYVPDTLQTTPRTRQAPTRQETDLPEVASSRNLPVPLTRAFIASKSHSDPLLLRRVQDQERLLPDERCLSGHTPRGRRTGHSVLFNNHQGKRQQRLTEERDSGKPSVTLPSLSVPANPHRRGSLSLPDLSDLPDVLNQVELQSDTSAEDSSGNESQEASDTNEDYDSDTETWLEEAETLRRKNAARRRRNSVSLPDLFCKNVTANKNHKTDSSLQNSPSGALMHLPLLSNQSRQRIHCGQKASDLKLPAIQLCNSPSLPALDRKSLRRQSLKKHNSAQNLDLSVRKPITGDGDSLRRLLSRPKDDVILQSVT